MMQSQIWATGLLALTASSIVAVSQSAVPSSLGRDLQQVSVTRANEDVDAEVLDDAGVLQVQDELAPILMLGLDHEKCVEAAVAELEKLHDLVVLESDGVVYEWHWDPILEDYVKVCIRESRIEVLDSGESNPVQIDLSATTTIG